MGLQPAKLSVSPNEWNQLQRQLNYLIKDIYSYIDELKGVDDKTPIVYSTSQFESDITVGGNITVAGTVDGVDIAARDAILTAAYAHISNDGSHHSFIDQSVVSGANVTLGTIGCGVITQSGTTLANTYQAKDATLSAIADLGTGADKMIYATGLDTWSEATITAAGRALLDDAAASNQRTTLELGADTTGFGTINAILAVANAAIDLNSQNLTSVGTLGCDNIYAGGRPWFDVVHYGADPTGTDDSTTEIGNAVTAAGQDGVVFFPPGEYKMTGTAAISIASSQEIKGSGMLRTEIVCTTAAQNIFSADSLGVKISGFSFTSAETPTSGSLITFTYGVGTVSDIWIKKAYNGIEWNNNAAPGYGENLYIADYVNIGLYFNDCGDVYINHFLLNAGSETAAIGVKLNGQNEAIILSDGDILNGNYSLVTDGTWGSGTRPAYCKFNNVYFDSSLKGVTLDKLALSEFNSCWFSGGRSDTGYDGCTLTQTDSVSFVNTTFYGNGAHGCGVTADSVRSSFTGCKFQANSITAGSGVSHGLYFAVNTTDFQVINCIASKDNFSGGNEYQGYGIAVGVGTSDRYQIIGNICHNNVTGDISDGGTGTEKLVQGTASNVGTFQSPILLNGSKSGFMLEVTNTHATAGEGLRIIAGDSASEAIGAFYDKDSALRFKFMADGSGGSDGTWAEFSPTIGIENPTPNDYLDWALEDAKKPNKPYKGLWDKHNQKIQKIAAKYDIKSASDEIERYGKLPGKMAKGVTIWAEAARDQINSLNERVRLLEVA